MNCLCDHGCSACGDDGRSADAVLADRLAVALRRVLRAHEGTLNQLYGDDLRMRSGCALEAACDAVCDWAAVRGVVDEPSTSPWRRW